MSRHIFISYRRLDSEGYAGRLFDRLSSHFGIRNIFMDVDAIEAGVDFAREIEQAVQACDVLLALIGPQWLTVKDAQGKLRLEDPEDFVRLEIGIGLRCGIRVIPVLIQGASMPAASVLPEDLKSLAMRNAVELSSTRFHQDADRLVEAIERALDEREAERDKSAAATAFRSLHQLPQPPADFTGRDELVAQLMEDFEKGKGATITGQPIHGLVGMGGIGKTALGLVVAHQLKKDYPDAQIFLDLKGTTTPLTAIDVMRYVILSFEPEIKLRELDEKGMSNAYQSVLHGKRALLFLDNARSEEQIAPLRPPETCALLVTSRWTFGVPGLKNRHVGVMSQENAEKFLLELCPRIGDQADELAKACSYLPLALRIAGSFLNVNDDYSIDTYLTELDDRKARLGTLGENRKEAELRTEPDLVATFQQSYNQLAKEEVDANVQKYWRMIGVFPASFQSTAVEALWDLDTKETARRLRLYKRYSLIDFDENTLRYSLHDLLAAYAVSRMEVEEEKGARLKHAAYYREVLSAANDLYMEGGEKVLTGLRLFDLEWENIRTGQAWATGTEGDDRARTDLCIAYPNAGAYVLNLRQHPKQRIQWLEAALLAARQTDDREYEGATLGNLGIAYRNLGEIRKAIEFYEGSLAIMREIGDRQGEGTALGSLGLTYADLGEARKAIEFHEQRLAIVREIGDRRGEGQALGNLGNAYSDLGETHKAIEFYEERLAIARETGDRQGEGQALGNLGSASKLLGNVRKAIEFQKQRLAIVREIGDRRGEGRALGSLGVAYVDLGETYKAIEFCETSLAIAREIGDRQAEGNGLGNLGVAYAALGETHKAIEFQKQRLAIVREIGDRHGEGRALGGLGVAYVDLGETYKAIEFCETSLAIAREIGDRRGEGHALGNLGIAYAALGETHKAIEFYETSLAIARETGDRRGEGSALFNMGKALYDLEEKDRAIQLVQEALELYEAIESPTAERARNALKEWGAL